jgi:hypothetical protein
MSERRKVTLEATEIRETDAAWLLEIDGEEIWLPKSQVEWDGEYVTLPEWLAEERGLG